MPFDLSAARVFHGSPGNHRNQRRQTDCANGGFYRSPTAGQTIPSTSKMTISWDPTCIESDPKQVDIYLIAPYAAKPEIFRWKKVDYHIGTLDVDLLPKSWNSTSSVSLQLNIVEADLPPFLSSLPPGPVFQATYDSSAVDAGGKPAPEADSSVPFTPYVTVDNGYKPGGLSKGGLAAAVLFPLLAIFAAVAVYVRWTRAKEAKKRQRWSQAVDKRMSTISGDWKSISAAGASAAIRQSMAAGDRNTRASSFFAGNGPYVGRPSSTFAGEGNQAGIGARHAEGEGEEPEMAPLPRPRTSTLASGTARVSRVSFAADLPRPSMGGDSLRQSVYSTPGVPSRAFHRSGDESPPPLPTRTTYYEETPVSPNNPSYNLSPTQTEGPQSLTPDSIRSKIANGRYGDGNERPSVDGEFKAEVLQMPAMTLMRTGGNASDDYLIKSNNVDPYPALPSPRVSVPPLPLSNANGNKPAPYTSGMMPLSDASTTLSPDAMLRAYAAKRSTLKGPTSPIGPPQQMRTLYAPSESDMSDAYGSDAYSTTNSVGVGARNPNRLTVDVGSNNPFRTSMAPSVVYSETSRYSTLAPGQPSGYDIGKAA